MEWQQSGIGWDTHQCMDIFDFCWQWQKKTKKSHILFHSLKRKCHLIGTASSSHCSQAWTLFCCPFSLFLPQSSSPLLIAHHHLILLCKSLLYRLLSFWGDYPRKSPCHWFRLPVSHLPDVLGFFCPCFPIPLCSFGSLSLSADGIDAWATI